jgi:hypothetical protein
LKEQSKEREGLKGRELASSAIMWEPAWLRSFFLKMNSIFFVKPLTAFRAMEQRGSKKKKINAIL